MNGKDWLKKVERDLEEKIKENDFIYHERIPDEKTLAQVAKAAVAKPTPIPERLGDPSKELLFDALVPVPVHQVVYVNHICSSVFNYLQFTVLTKKQLQSRPIKVRFFY